MNCKPGDFAKVIEPHFRHGSIVEVVGDCTPEERGLLVERDPGWKSVEKVWLCRLVTGSRGINIDTGIATFLYPGAEAWFADAYLRPIRDPGDDAIDESAAWLPPVPLPVIDPSLLPAKETA